MDKIIAASKINIEPCTITSIKPPSTSHFLFENMDNNAIKYVIDNSVVREFKENYILVQQGDKSEYIYFLLKGTARTFRSNCEGQEITIRMLQQGETFMESAIFMEGNSPISAQTISAAEFLMIPKDFVKVKIMHNNQFASNLLQISTHHYKNIIQQVDSISTKTPTERVGYFLLKVRMDQVKQGIGLSDIIVLPFKKSMIASHLNMTPETFSRALKKLRSKGVRVEQDKIILDNTHALCEFCDSDMGHFCYRYETEDCPIDY